MSAKKPTESFIHNPFSAVQRLQLHHLRSVPTQLMASVVPAMATFSVTPKAPLTRALAVLSTDGVAVDRTTAALDARLAALQLSPLLPPAPAHLLPALMVAVDLLSAAPPAIPRVLMEAAAQATDTAEAHLNTVFQQMAAKTAAPRPVTQSPTLLLQRRNLFLVAQPLARRAADPQQLMEPVVLQMEELFVGTGLRVLAARCTDSAAILLPTVVKAARAGLVPGHLLAQPLVLRLRLLRLLLAPLLLSARLVFQLCMLLSCRMDVFSSWTRLKITLS